MQLETLQRVRLPSKEETSDGVTQHKLERADQAAISNVQKLLQNIA
jgi:hypothetical protein